MHVPPHDKASYVLVLVLIIVHGAVDEHWEHSSWDQRFVNLENTFCSLDKYILYFEQIIFVNWTNIFVKLENTFSDLDKYTLQFVQSYNCIHNKPFPPALNLDCDNRIQNTQREEVTIKDERNK